MTSTLSEILIDEDLLKLAQNATAAAAIPSSSLSNTDNPNNSQLDLNKFLLSLSESSNNPNITINTIPAISPTTYPDLDHHLIALFFAYANPGILLLNEGLFMSRYLPTNEHPPALLNAIKAIACLFSQHPKLLKQYKTQLRASQHYMALAEKQVSTKMDMMPAIQTMCLLGTWSYGINYGESSYNWIGQASREAEKFAARLADRLDYRFSVWRARLPEMSETEVETGMRVWHFAWKIDAYCAGVSGMPMAIDETEYEFMLNRAPVSDVSHLYDFDVGVREGAMSGQRSVEMVVEGQDQERGAAAGKSAASGKVNWVAEGCCFKDSSKGKRSPSVGEVEERLDWRDVFRTIPRESIYDWPSDSKPHPLLQQIRPPRSPRTPVYINPETKDALVIFATCATNANLLIFFFCSFLFFVFLLVSMSFRYSMPTNSPSSSAVSFEPKEP
jgi:hypothetical protein